MTAMAAVTAADDAVVAAAEAVGVVSVKWELEWWRWQC